MVRITEPYILCDVEFEIKIGFTFHLYSSGQEVGRVKIPAKKVSGLVFGGPNLDILFVATEHTGYDSMNG